MEKIEKLLKKISREDRERLLKIIERLLNKNKKGLQIKKVKDTDFFRLRSGRFRIIFHYDKSDNVIIDSIQLRDGNTYKL